MFLMDKSGNWRAYILQKIDMLWNIYVYYAVQKPDIINSYKHFYITLKTGVA